MQSQLKITLAKVKLHHDSLHNGITTENYSRKSKINTIQAQLTMLTKKIIKSNSFLENTITLFITTICSRLNGKTLVLGFFLLDFNVMIFFGNIEFWNDKF